MVLALLKLKMEKKKEKKIGLSAAILLSTLKSFGLAVHSVTLKWAA